MTRRRIEIERAGLRTPRERMWPAMRALAEFSIADVEHRAHPISRDAVRSYLQGLIAAGYVEALPPTDPAALKGKVVALRYRVVKSPAIVPQLDKHGQPIAPSLGTLAMWRAMKVRKVFDAEQLARDATQGAVTCTLATAKSYVSKLATAGYLRIEVKASPGGRLARYRLMKDTGPLPPAITRAKVVFDRNTGELSPVQTAQEVCDALDA